MIGTKYTVAPCGVARPSTGYAAFRQHDLREHWRTGDCVEPICSPAICRTWNEETDAGGGNNQPRMTRYPISFDDGAMLIPVGDLSEVAEVAGVRVFDGGVETLRAVGVATDGAVIGGFSIGDVFSRAEALEWAAMLAVACRCAHEVREIMAHPDA